MEKIHEIHGQCPAGVLERKQWTISSESMENVNGFFPWNPWILSMEIVDDVHGNYPWTMTMEKIHGHCPYNPWTFEQ